MKDLRVWGSIGVLLLLVSLAGAWQWTSLKDWLSLDEMILWGNHLRGNPLALAWVIAAFTIGGLVMFPQTLLVVATAITFEPYTAFFYSWTGCVVSAVVAFGVGHVVGSETVRRLVGSKLNSLSERIGREGLVAVLTIRVFPIAPYTVINFVAGASHIKFRDYVVGTLVGLVPEILAITVLGESLSEAIRHPRIESVLLLLALVVVFVFANIGVRRWLDRRSVTRSAA